MASEAEQFFMCLLAIFAASFEDHVFFSLAHLLTELFDSAIVLGCLCSLDMNPLLDK